ncbi:nucleotide-diphospho-sugar transferases [Lucifera butyrica]|uniref:Nucleotide-diphospho-sugar transferases n=1 Tax=Lucifera butyrica TaxID=1351585 RepID=A0A498RK41_9FIRM|nr:glycosyltransferase family 2 protein [Lucifera butyrica]VBB09408.1 nucleotide-diphospho-sugar transferases [Lucifera butyrica]
MSKITILIPCYNEQDVLRQLWERLNAVFVGITSCTFEILFVNDGSSDNTLTVIKSLAGLDSKISYIDLSRNFGKELAMIAGLDYATGDAVIIMDADLQHPPELIPEMIQYWQQGYDDVSAKRRKRTGENFFRRWAANTFYSFLQKITTIKIQENVGDFRLLDRRCVEAIKLMRETQRYTKGMFSWVGYAKKEIVFDSALRAAGETKWSFLSLVNLAIEGITSFTTFPLRISSIVGILISFFAFAYMAWIIFNTLMFGDPVQGFPTLLSVILFLGGIQLIFLGVIGEYLARVFNETKRRPLYFVNEYNGKKAVYRDEITGYRTDGVKRD